MVMGSDGKTRLHIVHRDDATGTIDDCLRHVSRLVNNIGSFFGPRMSSICK